ncbi:ubiquitin-conjugating enzyme [Artemisia annua]|uniref:Ubiquitin-conjugating enzyme n=1 Tax=Artemisia annua TaxID=35608 RepID=A0A2U1QHP8_ARTAN|nr:ubiquitin-conjugating enzyme [Artemisia annua]
MWLSLYPTYGVVSLYWPSNPNIHMRGEVNWFFLMEVIRRHGISNMLQLLVYIRDVFLSKNPLVGESYLRSSECNPTLDQQNSFLYNENVIIKSLRTMLYVINKPPKQDLFQQLASEPKANRSRENEFQGFIIESEGKKEGRR